MKLKSEIINIIIFLTVVTFSGCSHLYYEKNHAIEDDKRIYLYGEKHKKEKILNKEIALWEEYYNQQNLRHLFIEAGYSDAQLLNLWMKSNDDEYLNVIIDNLRKTVSGNVDLKYNFYVEIKKRCPETIFHGTDIEHQFNLTGEYYVQYLIDNNLTETEEYRLALENNEQGLLYYTKENDAEVYRENTMVKNFEREFDALPSDTKIMGIYGYEHTRLNSKNYSKEVDNMATQLDKYYSDKEGKIISSVNLNK